MSVVYWPRWSFSFISPKRVSFYKVLRFVMWIAILLTSKFQTHGTSNEVLSSVDFCILNISFCNCEWPCWFMTGWENVMDLAFCEDSFFLLFLRRCCGPYMVFASAPVYLWCLYHSFSPTNGTSCLKMRLRNWMSTLRGLNQKVVQSYSFSWLRLRLDFKHHEEF